MLPVRSGEEGRAMNGKTVRIIGALGILWNLAGVGSYLAHVGLFGPEAAAPPPGAAPMPVAIAAAYAIAVFAGLAGSVGLTMLQRWAAPMLWLSFAASVINWGWVFGYSAAGEVPLGVAVIVIALVLALVAGRAPQRVARAV
jgi:hypothetical protein